MNQTGRGGFRTTARLIFSPAVLRYFLLVMMPLLFVVLYTATLIPTLVTGQSSELLLSYCYIANGLAGFYLGPGLTRLLAGRLSLAQSLFGALLIGCAGVLVIGLPPFMVMVLVSSAIFGMLDGYGSPLAIDGFLALPAVNARLDETTATALYVALSNVVMAVVPVLIGALTEISVAGTVNGLAAMYLICAVVYALTGTRAKREL